jgi:hypothetical protein
MVWYMVWYGMVWYGMVWYGMVWYGMVWYGMVVRNMSLRACCHQLVNNLLRTDDIRLVGTTCCESVGLINLVTR